MPACGCLSNCPFFNDMMMGMDSVKDMMKRRYCHGANARCARYMVFKALGRAKVPADLTPNQTDRAEKIIAGR